MQLNRVNSYQSTVDFTLLCQTRCSNPYRCIPDTKAIVITCEKTTMTSSIMNATPLIANRTILLARLAFRPNPAL